MLKGITAFLLGKSYTDKHGGGSGSGDYILLTHKPQINSVELSGDMSSDDLGLASAADTYTKMEVDTALADKADMNTIYTKTEIDIMIGDVETLLSTL